VLRTRADHRDPMQDAAAATVAAPEPCRPPHRRRARSRHAPDPGLDAARRSISGIRCAFVDPAARRSSRGRHFEILATGGPGNSSPNWTDGGRRGPIKPHRFAVSGTSGRSRWRRCPRGRSPRLITSLASHIGTPGGLPVLDVLDPRRTAFRCGSRSRVMRCSCPAMV
jgi:hypothetical protein